MVNGKHTKFILTPIFEILEDCVNATRGMSVGIETYPLCDYIMQTTFLKMTEGLIFIECYSFVFDCV